MEDLKKMEVAQAERVSRGFAKEEEKHFLKSEYPEEELVGLDLYALMRTFKRIWSRHHDELQNPNMLSGDILIQFSRLKADSSKVS
ncbi:MAG: hypothetical protein R3B93_12050 [Bacteroidia bacterium]